MSFSAWYDPLKDEIHGAKKGTLFYRHEQGHQRSWKLKIEPQIQMYSWFAIICTIPFIGWSSGNILIGIISTIPLVGLFYSEMYAWYYAFIGYNFVNEQNNEGGKNGKNRNKNNE